MFINSMTFIQIKVEFFLNTSWREFHNSKLCIYLFYFTPYQFIFQHTWDFLKVLRLMLMLAFVCTLMPETNKFQLQTFWTFKLVQIFVFDFLSLKISRERFFRMFSACQRQMKNLTSRAHSKIYIGVRKFLNLPHFG